MTESPVINYYFHKKMDVNDSYKDFIETGERVVYHWWTTETEEDDGLDFLFCL